MTSLTPPTKRIAVAGPQGGTVNEHFGQADGFWIYDVGAGQSSVLEYRDIAALALEGEDRRETIRRILADCQALLVSRVGETPKAMMAEAGIDATADYADQPIEASLLAYFQKGADGPSEPEEDLDTPIDFTSFRLLHTMLRVSDMERSLDFYTRLLGMRVIEQREHKKNQFTQVYLGYGETQDQALIELVFNWNREQPYAQGEAYGHIAIAVKRIGALCKKLEAEAVPLPRPPRSQRHGNTIVAFVEDPDGYQIELVQYPDPAL